MARGRILTIEQEEQVIALYKQEFTIKEIIKHTGVKSEQTIYRILDKNNIPRRPKLKGVGKVFITVEEDVAQILEKQTNISLYVNEAIRFFNNK
ncbi:Helix-turn-helix domain of resolvase [Bacteroides ovatus]|uniref:Helix-turn-helix domain of resolvase n=1 Tax=Bacteroides ovatus TaxID=28116 RepID=A0A1G6G5Q7_BACOV|nr:helix-turn-helix domain-containing protein [Bacteroides ovatus]SDB77163.1 Helix-turn-helix domain of resolvase [Bacteroides ovatus]